ncbi:hypothetical protein MSAN_00861300 [Mycena sanguinolenta]|uniref:Uncharacterized protein n=1 Tax=Mycena sanguinolenta TaxID=230812 RepID=A0A8H7DDW7_9AGAR|nr:hypothetical protein MSAN_00861300 [Mycena sanguinolenta]
MALPFFGLLLLSSLVSAQSSGSLGNLTVPLPAGSTISAGDFLTYGYSYSGDFSQELRNVTAELVGGAILSRLPPTFLIISGHLDSNLNVVDLMYDHGNDGGSFSFSDDLGYWTSAATPPGNYQIRINGTVYNSTSIVASDVGTPVGNLSALSKPWILSQPIPFLCTIPTFTPVVSVTDPNYSPLRIGQPLAGTVYYLNNISTLGLILVSANFIDASFGVGDSTNASPATMEVVKSGSLESVGSVVLNGTLLQVSGLPTDKFKLTAGAFRVRADFTDPNHPGGNFSALSDEFYIASEGPCVGLQKGTSTTGGESGSNTTGKTGAALSGKIIPFTGLLTLFAGATLVLA